MPVQPVIIAEADDCTPQNPDETPNIIEEKKQLFESVVENQPNALHDSFIQAMNFHRQANGNISGTHLDTGSQSFKEETKGQAFGKRKK